MGDYGIDKWYYRMEEHKRKGHRINEYAKRYAETKITDLNIAPLEKLGRM